MADSDGLPGPPPTPASTASPPIVDGLATWEHQRQEQVGLRLPQQAADSLSSAEPFQGQLEVSGGFGGTMAAYVDLETLARLSEETGANLAAIVRKCADMMTDADVLASAVLNPVGAARFEAALLDVVNGSDGLGQIADDLRQHAVLLRQAARTYRALDEGQARLIDSVRWAGGYGVGSGAPLLAVTAAPFLVLAGGAAYAAGEALGVDWRQYGETALTNAQIYLSEHPGLRNTIVGALPGLISGLPLGVDPVDVPSGAGMVGVLYPDGKPRVEFVGFDESELANRAPTGFGDLMTGLAHRNEVAKADNQGQIDIREITHEDGRKAFIVNIPGTKDAHPMPFTHEERLNDMATNLRALGGQSTSYGQGILQALDSVLTPERLAEYRAAHGGESPKVLLTGHSQGGIVAAQLASDPAIRERYNITHVVTAGAPIARFDMGDIKVLSLENKHDPIPSLDGAENRDRPNHTTVTFSDQRLRLPPEEGKSIANNHFMADVYLPAGKALDQSTSSSVTAFRESAADFFGGQRVATTVHEITRTK